MEYQEINKALEGAVSIKSAMEQGSGKVKIRGFVHRERGSKKLKFIVMRDVTGLLQCVIEKEKVGEEKFEIADKLQVETSIIIEGEIKKDERAPTGFEINADNFWIIGESNQFPITKDQSIGFLADNRHLWARSTRMTSIMKIRSTVFGAIHEFYRQNKFYEHQSPIFQSNQCEGGSTLFECNYFGKKIYLSQSWQLHAEAMVFGLEKIYTIAPSFRAEKSQTSKTYKQSTIYSKQH